MNAIPALHDMSRHLETLPIDLHQTDFFRSIVTELAELIEQTVGLKQAEGFITAVGMRMGRTIAEKYADHAQDSPEKLAALAAVLVDLKRRISGDFYVIEVAETHLILGNKRCPFGAAVEGRRSLCMMTANVFGRIAADVGGYARVAVEKSFAAGDSECRVYIDLSEDSSYPYDAENILQAGEFFSA